MFSGRLTPTPQRCWVVLWTGAGLTLTPLRLFWGLLLSCQEQLFALENLTARLRLIHSRASLEFSSYNRCFLDVLGFGNKWKIRAVSLGEKPGLGLERSQENEFLFPQVAVIQVPHLPAVGHPCSGDPFPTFPVARLSQETIFYLNVPPSASRLWFLESKGENIPLNPPAKQTSNILKTQPHASQRFPWLLQPFSLTSGGRWL